MSAVKHSYLLPESGYCGMNDKHAEHRHLLSINHFQEDVLSTILVTSAERSNLKIAHRAWKKNGEVWYSGNRQLTTNEKKLRSKGLLK
jgi:hypothetical protein